MRRPSAAAAAAPAILLADHSLSLYLIIFFPSSNRFSRPSHERVAREGSAAA